MDRITRTCPVCGRQYTQAPAISRKDNATPICPECGIREALTALGLTSEQSEKIVREAMAAYNEKE